MDNDHGPFYGLFGSSSRKPEWGGRYTHGQVGCVECGPTKKASFVAPSPACRTSRKDPRHPMEKATEFLRCHSGRPFEWVLLIQVCRRLWLTFTPMPNGTHWEGFPPNLSLQCRFHTKRVRPNGAVGGARCRGMTRHILEGRKRSYPFVVLPKQMSRLQQ